MAAALKGHESTVNILLQSGANVSHTNKNGDSVIRYVAFGANHARLA